MSSDDSALRDRKILIVDDHEPHRTLLANYLGALGCECTCAGGGAEALAHLKKREFDLVLLDLRMDDLDGMEVLKRARVQNVALRCIMMSAEGTISHAVEAIRLGAKDFLVKPFELEQLHETVFRVVGGRQVEGGFARDPRSLWRDAHAPDMIGEHTTLLEVFLVLERISHTDCTVLVLGESGTGKELVARAIHHASGRREQPFVPVNCGAIPETLIESELFGHAKGAYTGATQAREGRFAVADHGTLFLDEIGEMSLAVQVKFLRVLQEQEFVPVGETRPRKCDVRIIAATNKNLEEMAGIGTFREDLFYRLNLIPIHLPPLRDRTDDIPRLSAHFLTRLSKRREQTLTGFTDNALEAMMNYTWPGNVRELENTVERMSLLHQGSGMLELRDLPPRVMEAVRRRPVAPLPIPDPPPFERSEPIGRLETSVLPHDSGLGALPHAGVAGDDDSSPFAPPLDPKLLGSPYPFQLPVGGIILKDVVQAFEMSLISQALARTNGNRNKAARLLGMNRTTLVEKLRRGGQPRGVDPEPSDPRQRVDD